MSVQNTITKLELRAKLLNAAYEVLSDPVKRREHDMSRLRGQQQTIGDTSTMQCPWWFLVLGWLVVLLLLLRFSVKLLLIAAPVFLLLWLLMNWQRQRK